MTATPTTPSDSSLERGQLGLFGVIMPGVAQIAPAFNLFFTTGLIVALAGASAHGREGVHPVRRAAHHLGVPVQRDQLLRRGEHKSVWLWVVVPLIGIVVLAIPLWGDLRPGQPSPYNVLPWLALGLIAVGIIYQYVLGRLRPDALASAPALLEGEPDETPDGSDSQALVV